LDLRYESFRLKVPALEERLLSSLLQRGIEEPLEGVESNETKVLLNGFKRYRCARKLRLATVPYRSLGRDEAAAILGLLKLSNNRTLSLLEQAAFIAELKNVRGLNVAEIAAELARSKSWVTLRLGLMAQMSVPVRQEILKGNLALPLQWMRQVPQSPDGCSEFERVLLGDLELTQKYMQRVMGKSQEQSKLTRRAFHAQCHLLTAGILSRSRAFFDVLRQLHDRNGQE
jgi:hypothetical protein